MKASMCISHYCCDFSELLSSTGLDSRSSWSWVDSMNKICSHGMCLPSVPWLYRPNQPPDKELLGRRMPFTPFSLHAPHFSQRSRIRWSQPRRTGAHSVVGAVPDPAYACHLANKGSGTQKSVRSEEGRSKKGNPNPGSKRKYL